jgi:predicted small secreted protein
MLTKILIAVMLIFVAFYFTGCQTVQGVGRDITWTGRAGAEVIDQIIYPPHKNQQPKVAYENY